MDADRDLSAIETKLASARTRLILDKPFLGALVLRLPLEATSGDWCPTTATDARAFYYNPRYIDALSLDETQFMLAHEALHCALSHFARRQHRVKHKWDLACDYAINPLLIDDGLKPPPNALVMPMYKGMTAEEIYPLIDDNDQSETLDTHAYDRDSDGQGRQSGMDERDLKQRQADSRSEQGEQGQGASNNAEQQQRQPGNRDVNESEQSEPPPRQDGPPQPLTPDERETLQVQWQQRMAGAAQQALQAGKLGGELKRMIDHLLQPFCKPAVQVTQVAEPPDVQAAIEHYLSFCHKKPILNGHDLQKLGVPPGPELGQLLKELRAARLDGVVSNRSEEEAWVLARLNNDG